MPYIERKAKQEGVMDIERFIIHNLSLEDGFSVREYGTYYQWDSCFDERTGYARDAGDDYDSEGVEFDEDSIMNLLKTLGIENKFQEIMNKLDECFEWYGDEWWS